MAQLVEHILGKDEVPGPNPGSSSRQPRRESSGALVLFGHFCTPTCFGLFRRGCPELLLSLREQAVADCRSAYPTRSSTSLLVRQRVWVSSPSANTRVRLRGFGFICTLLHPYLLRFIPKGLSGVATLASRTNGRRLPVRILRAERVVLALKRQA